MFTLYDIKPCPFCNSKAELLNRDDGDNPDYVDITQMYDVKCTNDECYLSEGAGLYLDDFEVVELWNRRK